MEPIYRIRPLKWEFLEPSQQWTAYTILGHISVYHWSHGGVVYQWFLCGGEDEGDSGLEPCDSLDDGKAKATAIYHERLMKALEEVK